jgi:hypothetical protein
MLCFHPPESSVFSPVGTVLCSRKAKSAIRPHPRGVSAPPSRASRHSVRYWVHPATPSRDPDAQAQALLGPTRMPGVSAASSMLGTALASGRDPYLGQR